MSAEVLFGAAPENNGAGGSGLRGLPPYFEEGVPGRGLPLMSGGSYTTLDGGGLVQSDEPLDGVNGRTGETRPEPGMYGGTSVGGTMFGA